MLVLPLLTMRLFAEEKKLGTMELLWTYPVRDGEIVLGKFLAAWLFFVAMLLPTAIGPADLLSLSIRSTSARCWPAISACC